MERKAGRKKVRKFQREKITTGRDITKNVEGGADSAPPPPPGSFRVNLKWNAVGPFHIKACDVNDSKNLDFFLFLVWLLFYVNSGCRELSLFVADLCMYRLL